MLCFVRGEMTETLLMNICSGQPQPVKNMTVATRPAAPYSNPGEVRESNPLLFPVTEVGLPGKGPPFF